MLEDFKNLFRGGNFIGQIVIINAIVFLADNIITNFSAGAGAEIMRWFAMHPFLPTFLTSPWSAVTYMFFHGGFSHIFWNMVLLYWFGKIIHDFMGKKRLIWVYFLGGISGAMFYLGIKSIEYLSGEIIADVPLIGASAGIMALVSLAGFRFGDYKLNMLFIGQVPLKYVALAIFIMNTVLDFNFNTGGKMAHLGGAAFGFFYHRSLGKGKDLITTINDLFEQFKGLFARKPRMRIVVDDDKHSARPVKSDMQLKAEIQAKTNAILDKISKSGYENLSKEEKEFLFKLSNKN
jgi:membrane associated rhomboid family serine protease